MKILAFAASNSKFSINKRLVTFAAGLVEGAQSEILDLNDFELPLYSEDREHEMGHPMLAAKFLNKISDADALIISFAEHNGSYTAAFKNLFDWCSRKTQKVWQGKSMILLSTSPGQRGGLSVLTMAVESAPYFDGIVKGSMSVPSFYQNYDAESQKIRNPEILNRLHFIVNNLAR